MAISDAGEAAAESHEPNDTPTQPPESDYQQPTNTQDAAAQPTELTGSSTKKKKSRGGGKKSLAQRGPAALPKNRGSGFEEYFADPPMTPQEAMEEKDEIYAEDLPFEERIQSCIQRFRSRRRLQGEMTRFFDEYLFLGGVDTTPVAFSGVDPRDLKDLNPAERREATAKDFVGSGSAAGDRFYNGDAKSWFIDFAGVAAGFFSVGMIPLTGFDGFRMETAIGVVENFLRYVLHHDVCPEFADNIQDALQVCNDARGEWPMLNQLGAALPGDFNSAATQLFSPHTAKAWSTPTFERPGRFNAIMSFFVTLQLLDGQPHVSPVQPEAKPTNEYDCTLELVEIIRPNKQVTERFRTVTLDEEHPGMPPVGRVMCKLATIEDGWDQGSFQAPFAEDTITLYFEDTTLVHLKVGVKISVRLCEMGKEFRFVKTVYTIVPSFYTFPPQEMMRHHKPPRENERPAPSVRDPHADEVQDGGDDGDE